MKVVGHRIVAIDVDSKSTNSVLEEIDKVLKVTLFEEHLPAVVATIRHMDGHTNG